MDINCIHKCFYQTDGKCTLRSLPQELQLTNNISTSDEIDCLYFKMI